ncbi:MAG TPA: alpha/beta fold hydrolase, partial [Nevskiaceae bacterium]|nr:alpha/beta fold hydrolase [Nevskiaceae bacterium]
MSLPYRHIDLPRAGATLRAGIWGNGPRIVLASHGITANHVTFKPIVDRLDAGDTLIAPDHRGRARSNGIAGPWGMQEHAEDLIALLDHLHIDRVDVLLGQSMGGFVSAVAAARHPQRFGAL